MSTSPTINNLDRLAAKYAQKLVAQCLTIENAKAKDIEISITKGLGVLQENGVYACFLYFLAKEKKFSTESVEIMLDLLQDLPFEWIKPISRTPSDLLDFVAETVTRNLEQLLLAKEILEQMLIYARYGAKAQGDA